MWNHCSRWSSAPIPSASPHTIWSSDGCTAGRPLSGVFSPPNHDYLNPQKLKLSGFNCTYIVTGYIELDFGPEAGVQCGCGGCGVGSRRTWWEKLQNDKFRSVLLVMSGWSLWSSQSYAWLGVPSSVRKSVLPRLQTHDGTYKLVPEPSEWQ